jgi:hypothetical protein
MISIVFFIVHYIITGMFAAALVISVLKNKSTNTISDGVLFAIAMLWPLFFVVVPLFLMTGKDKE